MNSIITWVIRYLSNISSAQWKQVLEYVRVAADKITEGADKKAWVLEKLNSIGVKGSIANFLVEAAVTLLKKQGRIEL